jgi:hypothetical protein
MAAVVLLSNLLDARQVWRGRAAPVTVGANQANQRSVCTLVRIPALIAAHSGNR